MKFYESQEECLAAPLKEDKEAHYLISGWSRPMYVVGKTSNTNGILACFARQILRISACNLDRPAHGSALEIRRLRQEVNELHAQLAALKNGHTETPIPKETKHDTHRSC